MNRCVGCKWRTPQKYGGQGIICKPSENGEKCPSWVIEFALCYSKNSHGKPRKSFTSDEQLLEALRL